VPAASAALVGRADRIVGAHVSSQQAIGEENLCSGELSPQHDEQRAFAGFETDPAATATIIRTRMNERIFNARTAFPCLRIPRRSSCPLDCARTRRLWAEVTGSTPIIRSDRGGRRWCVMESSR
jgi:hypothetical protein